MAPQWRRPDPQEHRMFAETTDNSPRRRPMKRMRSRLGIRTAMGIAVVAVALAIPQLASASTVAPGPIAHNGTFTTGRTLDGGSTNTRTFVTQSLASTCVDVTSLTGSWHYELIWYNGGRNTVLFASRTFTTHGIHCSPTEYINGNSPKVYDQISVTGVASQASGNYQITTN
jgi:hypothetical protein